jgi:ceramide glucosyltransferase
MRRSSNRWGTVLRWARLRQASFKRYYALEALAGGFGPLIATAFIFGALGWPVGGVIALAAMWYGAEAALAHMAGWHLSMRSPLAWMLRDMLLPMVWIGGWLGRDFVWRGNQMRAVESRGTI